MRDSLETEDFTDWDWLPRAAEEIEAYLKRLLTEGAITAHDVTARHKSISSYRDKCRRKRYDKPRSQVTDSVAARVITYSITDRNRVRELVRARFEICDGEDRMPGNEKPERRRGYDCAHLVISREKTDAPPGWLVAGGELARYFERFKGLEIQIRTVAAHAWAEFEHHIRYKGAEYPAIGDHDQATVDQLFGAASDARRALDETFVAIERVLSNPTGFDARDRADEELFGSETGPTPIDEDTMRTFLEDRFPDDGEGSAAGLRFACSIVEACRLESIEALSNALGSVDGEQVRQLIATTTPITRVRRLDDELLALYGEQYIQDTSTIGAGSWIEGRSEKLQWRFDKLRRKVHVYEVTGQDCPHELRGVRMAAARAVREVARVIAGRKGPASVVLPNTISLADDLPGATRPREIRLDSGGSIWVATNLNRAASEKSLQDLLGRAGGNLRVMKSGVDLALNT